MNNTARQGTNTTSPLMIDVKKDINKLRATKRARAVKHPAQCIKDEKTYHTILVTGGNAKSLVMYSFISIKQFGFKLYSGSLVNESFENNCKTKEVQGFLWRKRNRDQI